MNNHDNIGDPVTKVVNIKKISNSHARACKSCIICGEPVELSELEAEAIQYSCGRVESKVCAKCRKAIMYIRGQID